MAVGIKTALRFKQTYENGLNTDKQEQNTFMELFIIPTAKSSHVK